MVQARSTTAASGSRSSPTAVAAIRAASLAAIASTVLLATITTAHPLCYFGPDRAVSMTADPTFCPNEDPEGFCCEPDEEAAVISRYDDAGPLSDDCASLYKEVLCGICSPYSAHLYTRMAVDDGLAMTAEFCISFVDACGKELALASTYCDEHVLDGDATEYWSYPLDIDGAFSDSDVNPAFPNLAEETLPPEPMAMHMTPDGTAWWIAGMAGYIKQASTDDPDDAFDVLDISGKIEHSYEQGLMGFAFSPSFTKSGLFYVSYTIPGDRNPENAKNVLSKFVYHVGDRDATYDSEEVLITTSEKSSTVHSSGWVGFTPSSYKDPTGAYHDLYWTVGDGGPQNDPDNRAQDRTEYHGSIVRIAVPSDAGETGYKIPSGNAFDGSNDERPEICAWGFRNPFRCGFDRDTDELYCGDVGQDAVEEVDIVECGKDYGWRMFEGDRCNDGYDDADDCSGLNREAYSFPTFQYCHFDYDSASDEYDVCGDRTITGLSVIGGYVYRGVRYADVLGGHYIFADHSTGVLHHLAPSSGGGWTAGIILTSIPKVAGFAEDNDGEVYIIGYQGNIYDLPCGTLCEHGGDSSATTSCFAQSDNIPTYKEIGCFADGSPKAMSRAPACDTMSAEMCASYCATMDGVVYFAMEYQRECYCAVDGDEYDRYGEIDGAECNMPCSGYPSERCGGDGTMNVYAITGEGSSRATSSADAVSEGSPAIDGSLAAPTAENYLGCYADDEDDRALTHGVLKSENMSVEECQDFCSEREATIFGLEYGHECYCGNDESDFEYYGEVDTCDTPCIGDGATACGGRLSLSVYTMEGVDTAAPTDGEVIEERESSIEWFDSFYPSIDDDGANDEEGYEGCYVDERGDGRVLKSKVAASDNMTVGKCRAFCEDSRIFGLEYGEECWCGDGDSFDAEEVHEEECDHACAGNLETRCGGYWRISVYKTD